jgi:hypothetical protein
MPDFLHLTTLWTVVLFSSSGRGKSKDFYPWHDQYDPAFKTTLMKMFNRAGVLTLSCHLKKQPEITAKPFWFEEIAIMYKISL